MSAERPIEIEGTITTVLPGTMFRVVLDNKHEVLAQLSGKMRKNFDCLTILATARFRRLARDYERLADTLAAYHWLALATLLLHSLFATSP